MQDKRFQSNIPLPFQIPTASGYLYGVFCPTVRTSRNSIDNPARRSFHLRPSLSVFCKLVNKITTIFVWILSRIQQQRTAVLENRSFIVDLIFEELISF